jgi:acyl carrier protein
MNDARAKVRSCLAEVKPNLDVSTIRDDAPLLEDRIITSFDVVDLLLHLEHASGQSIQREQLQPGSFRDIATIARVFFSTGPAR